MKKCDCFNQHDQEIRDVLNDLKSATLQMKDKSKILIKLTHKYEEAIKNYEEPNPLVGILLGACIMASIVSIATVIIKLVR
jgi:hypothetical protein